MPCVATGVLISTDLNAPRRHDRGPILSDKPSVAARMRQIGAVKRLRPYALSDAPGLQPADMRACQSACGAPPTLAEILVVIAGIRPKEYSVAASQMSLGVNIRYLGRLGKKIGEVVFELACLLCRKGWS